MSVQNEYDKFNQLILALNTILLGDDNSTVTLGGVTKPSISNHLSKITLDFENTTNGVISQVELKLGEVNGMQTNAQAMIDGWLNAINMITLEQGTPALAISDSSGISQQQVNDQTLRKTQYFNRVLGERDIRFDLNHSKGSLRYGLSDVTDLDDNKNHFRGLKSLDAWGDPRNIGTGSVSFGRNGASYAYLSTTLGHDAVAYGVASFAGGAGACTGNPDIPDDGANYGYCSFAYGKDSIAMGRISNAMGQECESNSRYSSTDGYQCKAGKALPTHPDYTDEGSEGAAARAHGYDSQAYGNFAFAYGSLLRAYNGCQLIGKGMSSSKRGVGIGYGVDRPTIFAKEGNGLFAWVGFNTDAPLSKYDYRLGYSDTISYTLDAQGGTGTAVAFEVKGLLGNNSYASLHNVIVTHTNTGQPYGTVEYRLNGNPYLTVDQTRHAKFFGAVEAGGEGFVVQGKRVVGGQLPSLALLPETATLAEVIARCNELLLGERAHGLRALP